MSIINCKLSIIKSSLFLIKEFPKLQNPPLDCIQRRILLGNTAQWELRASADLLPQSRSMKNGKYIQYSRIFHAFACAKISRRISLPHYAVLPYSIFLSFSSTD